MHGEHLRRYKYLWRKCQQRDVVIAAWKKLRKGKTRRIEVQKIEADFDNAVDDMIEQLRNTYPGGDLRAMFTPCFLRPKIIFEHGKQREIYRPPIWDQWFHHIVIWVLAPIIMKSSYLFSCGSMPGRGGVFAKKHIEKILRKNRFKYFAKLDIRHFFNSVDLKFVIAKLNLLIEDSWFIYLIERMFLYFHDKLPLGFYPSQWLANYILCPLDWVIKRRRPKVFIRYVDDFVIGADNKKYLHNMIKLVNSELRKIGLHLKGNYQVAKFEYINKDGKRIGRHIDFMGFVFKAEHTILRKSIMLRATRFARKLKKLPIIAAKQAQSMLSRNGWFKHTDTKYIWCKHVQPNVSIVSMKDIVRRWTFKHNKKEENHGSNIIVGDFGMHYRRCA